MINSFRVKTVFFLQNLSFKNLLSQIFFQKSSFTNILSKIFLRKSSFRNLLFKNQTYCSPKFTSAKNKISNNKHKKYRYQRKNPKEPVDTSTFATKLNMDKLSHNWNVSMFNVACRMCTIFHVALQHKRFRTTVITVSKQWVLSPRYFQL